MGVKKLSSSNEHQKLHQWAIDSLFRDVFPHMSDLFCFNLAYFSVGGNDGADAQFRQALTVELFRRGLLEVPHLDDENVDVTRFTKDDIKAIKHFFACDEGGSTQEDCYVELFTERNRWAERNFSKQGA